MTDPHCRLLLVPTDFEWSLVEPQLPATVREAVNDENNGWRVARCGFGPIVAAATTSRLLATFRPRDVLLLGIAGSYSDRAAVGAAVGFRSVVQYGVGAGSGAAHQSMQQLGWVPLAELNGMSNVDRFELKAGSFAQPHAAAGPLVTVCSASADQHDVQQRLQIWPDAVAEDMEGYAVALACHLAGIPLQIVRGISNRAGDRDKTRWQIGPALQAAVAAVEWGD